MIDSFNEMPIGTRFQLLGMWVWKETQDKAGLAGSGKICKESGKEIFTFIRLSKCEKKAEYYIHIDYQRSDEVKVYYQKMLNDKIDKYLYYVSMR